MCLMMWDFVTWDPGWLVDCKFESSFPLVGPGIIGGMASVRVFLRDPNPYLSEFRRKSRKGRQSKPKIEPSTSRLLVLSGEPLHHWWGHEIPDYYPCSEKHSSIGKVKRIFLKIYILKTSFHFNSKLLIKSN